MSRLCKSLEYYSNLRFLKQGAILSFFLSFDSSLKVDKKKKIQLNSDGSQKFKMVPTRGLEPPTHALRVRCSTS